MEHKYKGHSLIINIDPDEITQSGTVYYHNQLLEEEDFKAESRIGSFEYVLKELQNKVDMRIAGVGLNILSTIAPDDPIYGGKLLIEVWNAHAEEYIKGQQEQLGNDNKRDEKEIS